MMLEVNIKSFKCKGQTECPFKILFRVLFVNRLATEIDYGLHNLSRCNGLLFSLVNYGPSRSLLTNRSTDTCKKILQGQLKECPPS